MDKDSGEDEEEDYIEQLGNELDNMVSFHITYISYKYSSHKDSQDSKYNVSLADTLQAESVV